MPLCSLPEIRQKFDSQKYPIPPHKTILTRFKKFSLKILIWAFFVALGMLTIFGIIAFMVACVVFFKMLVSKPSPNFWVLISELTSAFRTRTTFDAKEWLQIAVSLLSLAAFASIPLGLELRRQSEASQKEITRLTNILSDRFFYVEVIAVTWEVASKWLSWTGECGDRYRVEVAGAMLVFEQKSFASPEAAEEVPYQNRIRFQPHTDPLGGFSKGDGSDFNRPNEHMIFSIWLSFWRDVERDIRHRRISVWDAYERLSHFYCWHHDFHQQLWMVEYILKESDFETGNSLESLKDIMSLEARFRICAEARGDRVRFELPSKNDNILSEESDNWSKAYKVAADLFARHTSNSQDVSLI